MAVDNEVGKKVKNLSPFRPSSK